jgi:hypothetical protein
MATTPPRTIDDALANPLIPENAMCRIGVRHGEGVVTYGPYGLQTARDQVAALRLADPNNDADLFVVIECESSADPVADILALVGVTPAP